MAFDEGLRDLMAATLTIAPVSSRDKFGAITYGDAVTYSCRLTERQENVVTFNGSQVLAGSVAWCAPHASSGIPNLTPDCKVTLPDGSTPTLLRFETIADEQGDYSFKLFFDRPYRE